ncbi:folate family ECF transporter S component [Anoxybacterium hadale]|uniref:Folate family ECF transporter S component n=1 Tax=Anoxybacterium hadale TaxID=3408580 RepID=A0ACD1AG45_9FIRM|nr:folate family ECF transporter S component [Clostridiales bacterium]
MKESIKTRKVVISAVFVSISVGLKAISSFYLPLFGQNGISVGISGVFTILPAILFGPVYGAMASGLADFLGYLMKPVGPYLPLMTLVVAAGGFLRGWLWIKVCGLGRKKFKSQIPPLLLVLISSGIFVTTLNTVILRETVFEAWKVLPFAAVWLPRVIEELVSNIVKAYIVAVLLRVARKHTNLRELMDERCGGE